jgi:secreted trypsin-like serine protease
VKIKLATLAGIIAVLALAGSAAAITWGQRDGGAHPNVGALVAEWRTPGVKDILCTGTLVAPRVFMTAAHCTDYLLHVRGITDAWVTFNTNGSVGPYLHGTMHQDPAYPGPSSDPHDIAVLVLDQPAPGVAPALLPGAGLLDRMKDAGTLDQASAFTAVGYGDRERVKEKDGPTFQFDGYRWVATSYFNALNKAWLRLTQNASVGAGGTCFGDSGGPNFLGSSNVIAAITITGDSQCVSTNVDYRVDTPGARAFLAQFGVPLP